MAKGEWAKIGHRVGWLGKVIFGWVCNGELLLVIVRR